MTTVPNMNKWIVFDAFMELCRDLFHFYFTSDAYVVDPRAQSTLKHLVDKKYKLGVLSNSDDRLLDILTTLKMDTYFDLVIDSKSAGIQKPKPGIFQYFQREGGISDPSDIVYVGNEYDMDYRAPRDVGWNAVLLTKSSDIDTSDEAVESIDTIAELLKQF